jgi:3-dehydroquinate dehydratase/shikimate dehydrogenase
LIEIQLASSASRQIRSGGVRNNGTLLCAPVMAESVDKMLINMDKAKQEGADLVEVRLDSLKSFNPYEDLKTLIKECPLPTLVTYRFITQNSFMVEFFYD